MIENRAFLYGEALFVTMRVHKGKLLASNWHLKGLSEQIETYYLKRKLTFEEHENLKSNFELALNQRSHNHDIVRLTVYLDASEDLILDGCEYAALKFHTSSRKALEKKDLKLKTQQNIYRSEHSCHLKTPNYAHSFYLKNEALKAGFDDILYIEEDTIVEASTSNILCVKENKFYSPKRMNYHGSTLKVFDSMLGIEFKDIHLEQAFDYDSLFLLNAANILVCVDSIDGIKMKTDLNLLKKLKEDFYEASIK